MYVAWALTTLFLRSSGHFNTDPACRTGVLVRRLRKAATYNADAVRVPLACFASRSALATARTADARRALLVAHMDCSKGTGGVPLISIRFAVPYPQNSSIHGQQGPPPARLQSCPSLSRGWLSLHVLVGVGMPANYLSCARQPLGAREFRFCKLHYDCREVPG